MPCTSSAIGHSACSSLVTTGAGLNEVMVRFDCVATVCNPSRAALMSGLRPSTTGVYANGQAWQPVIDKKITLTTQFLAAGYNAFGTGKIYHGSAHRDADTCWHCHGAAFERCEGCSLHLSNHDGAGHYQTATGALACSVRCVRLIRMRASAAERVAVRRAS